MGRHFSDNALLRQLNRRLQHLTAVVIALILGWFLGVINHDSFDWNSLRFQSQVETGRSLTYGHTRAYFSYPRFQRVLSESAAR